MADEGAGGTKFKLYESLHGVLVDKALSLVVGLIGYFIFGPLVAFLLIPMGEFDLSEFVPKNRQWCLAILGIVVAVSSLAYWINFLGGALIVFAIGGAVLLVLSIPISSSGIVAGAAERTVFGAHMDLDFVLYYSGLLLLLIAAVVPVGRGIWSLGRVLLGRN